MKKIAFLSPRNKGGTYYYYKDISVYLRHKYPEIQIDFFHSYWGYFFLHFAKYDTTFSIVPFFFRPLRIKKYYFNLHGNFKAEGNMWSILKTFKIYEKNLNISDNIILVSYYLSDVLKFGKSWKKKIIIIPNFTENKILPPRGSNFLDKQDIYIFTITSFSFVEKSRGVYDMIHLLSVLSKKFPEKNFNFSVIGNNRTKIGTDIQNTISNTQIPSNLNVIWEGWKDKMYIDEQWKKADYFFYISYLDNFPGVLLDAFASGIPVIVNDFKSFSYFLDSKYLKKSQQDMLTTIIHGEKQDNSFMQEYTLDRVSESFLGLS